MKEMRCATNGRYPKYAVWENVPGCYSSNGGEDFRCVLEELIKIKDESAVVPKYAKWEKAGLILEDNFSLAWRTLDSQYFGVPQRRRRCYLVIDFDGERAGKILFESESLSGYSPKSLRTWKGTAESSETGSGTASEYCMCDQGGQRIDVLTEKTSTLRAEAHHPPLVFEKHSQDSRYKGPLDVAQTVSATYGTGGNNQPFVVEQTAYGICSKHSNSIMSDNPNSGFYKADTAKTLDTSNQSPNKNQGGMVVVEGNGSRPSHQGDGYSESETMYTLNCTENHAVAFSQDAYDKYSENTHCGSLKASGGNYGGGSEAIVYSDTEYIVKQISTCRKH